VEEAVRIARQVAEALGHAHRHGIVHRDIKPENVFLHRAASELIVPKVLDFGIAHLLAGRRLTGRLALGTPRYAAPEQLAGETPTGQSDIYAAGHVLRELLTGEVPFAGLHDAGAIALAQLRSEPAPLAARVHGVPRSLDRFLAAMTAREPDARPPTAFSAAVALREVHARLEAAHLASLAAAPEVHDTEPTPLDNALFAPADGTPGDGTPCVRTSAHLLAAHAPHATARRG
jgi:serine/threonine-protein kinase